MLTQCPQCKTTYQLQVKQLKAAGGQVRCSRCHTVFDALENVVASTTKASSQRRETHPPQHTASPPTSQQKTKADQASSSESANRIAPPTGERITPTFGKSAPKATAPVPGRGDPLDDFINELESTTRHSETPAKRQTPENTPPKKRRGDQALLSAALESIDEIMARAMSHEDSSPADADDENATSKPASLPPSPSQTEHPQWESDSKRAIDDTDEEQLIPETLPLIEPEEMGSALDLIDDELTPELLPIVEPDEEFGPTLALIDDELTPELMPLDAPEEWFTTYHNRDDEDIDSDPLPLIEDEVTFDVADESAREDDDLEPLLLLEPEAEVDTATADHDDDFDLEPLPLLEPEEEVGSTTADHSDDFDLEPLPLLEPEEEVDTTTADQSDDFDLEPLPPLEPEEEVNTATADHSDNFDLEPLPLLEPDEELVDTLDIGHEAVKTKTPEPFGPAEVSDEQPVPSVEKEQAVSSSLKPKQAARQGNKRPAPPFQELEPVERLTSAAPLLSDEESAGLFKGLEIPQTPQRKKVQKVVKKPSKEHTPAAEGPYRMVQGDLLTPAANVPVKAPPAAKKPGAPKGKKPVTARPTTRQAPPQAEQPPHGAAPTPHPAVEEEAAIPPTHEQPPQEAARLVMAEPANPLELDDGDHSERVLADESGAEKQAANYAIPADLTSPRRPGGHPLLWGIGIVIMCACLVLQYLYYFRMQLVGNPQLRPLFTVMCEMTGCELPPRRDVSKIVVTERSMQFHPTYEQSLLLTATLTNTADFDQPYPLLEVIMTDIEQHTVARRHFLPQQYVNNYTEGDTFVAHSEIPLLLEVLDPGNSAVGFEFRFY